LDLVFVGPLRVSAENTEFRLVFRPINGSGKRARKIKELFYKSVTFELA